MFSGFFCFFYFYSHSVISSLLKSVSVDDSLEPEQAHALKSLEFKSDYEPPKKLLRRVKEWTDFLGGDKGQTDLPDLGVSFSDDDG